MSRNWGYVKSDTYYKNTEKMLSILIDIVSKGGNLLLNAGPLPNGKLNNRNIASMDSIGTWMKINGEAIYQTRPWKEYGIDLITNNKSEKNTHHSNMKDAVSDETNDITKFIRYTQKGNNIYVFIKGWSPGQKVELKSNNIINCNIKKLKALGTKENIKWGLSSIGLSFTIPKSIHNIIPIYVIKIETNNQKK